MSTKRKMEAQLPPEAEEEMYEAAPQDYPGDQPEDEAPPAEGAPQDEELLSPEEEAQMPPAVLKMLKASISASQKLAKQNETLAKQNRKLAAALQATRKAAPPGDDVEYTGELPVHNDDDQVRGKPGKEGAVGPVENTRTPVKENPKVFGKSFDMAVHKAVDERMKDVDKRVTDIVKAHTPVPMGYRNTPEGRSFAQMGLKAIVQKAIDFDRESAGGSYSTTEQFGWHPGTRSTRPAVVKMLRKAFA